jgi:hypothetical protein
MQNIGNRNFSYYLQNKPGLLKFFFDKKKNFEHIANRTQFRKLPDVSTSEFVNVILNDPVQRDLKNFINICFQIINYNVLTKLNQNIFDNTRQPNFDMATINEFLPMQYNEEVQLLFKGGTNFNFIYNNLKNQIPVDPNNPNIRNNILNLLRDQEIDSKLTVSDTDMSLHIHCNNNRRFILLQQVATKLVIESLEEISLLLDELWIHDHLPLNRLPPIPARVYNIENNFNQNIFDFIHVLQFVKETNDLNICYELIDTTFLTPNLLINNCQINSYLIEFIDYILIQNEINVTIGGIRITNQQIQDLTTYKNHMFIYGLHNLEQIKQGLIGVYTDAKKNTLRNNILNGLRQMKLDVNANKRVKNNTILEKDALDTVERYKFWRAPVLDDIHVQMEHCNINPANALNSCRSEAYLYDINNSRNPIHITNNTKQKIHYISINNTIANMVAKGRVNNFNLARIKCNMTLNDCCIDYNNTPLDLINYPNVVDNNIINDINRQNQYIIGDNSIKKYIPSEILDISITDHFSEKNHPYKNMLDIANKMGVRVDNYILLCYGYYDLYIDLKDVLFKQIHYSPWIDLKYDKRITRMFIFLCFAWIIELGIQYDILREIFINIRDMCNILKGNAGNNPDMNAKRAEFANNLNANQQFNELINEFCITPNNYNRQYCNYKMQTATNFSHLIDIKQKYSIMEDLIDGILINTLYYSDNNEYITLNGYFSNLYNFTAPADINNYKDDFINYIYKLSNIIDVIIPIFDIWRNTLEGYAYQQIIGGYTRKYNNKTKTKTKTNMKH